MTYEIPDDQVELLKEALRLGQEQMQMQWERSLSPNVPQEVSGILWKRWSDSRYLLTKLNLW